MGAAMPPARAMPPKLALQAVAVGATLGPYLGQLDKTLLDLIFTFGPIGGNLKAVLPIRE